MNKTIPFKRVSRDKKHKENEKIIFFQRLHVQLRLNYNSSVDMFAKEEIERHFYLGDSIENTLYILYDKYNLKPDNTLQKFTSEKVEVK